MAGVALGGIDVPFAGQAWDLVIPTFTGREVNCMLFGCRSQTALSMRFSVQLLGMNHHQHTFLPRAALSRSLHRHPRAHTHTDRQTHTHTITPTLFPFHQLHLLHASRRSYISCPLRAKPSLRLYLSPTHTYPFHTQHFNVQLCRTHLRK